MSKFPKTTPECERLLNMVIKGIDASVFEEGKRKSALVALKRLRKKRCVKALEYIMQVASDRSIMNTFATEVRKTATKYLEELS